MSFMSFKSLDDSAFLHVPDADTLVQRTSSHIHSVGGDGNSGHTIFDLISSKRSPSLDVPHTDGLVTASRGNMATVTSEVKGIDVLFVACKSMSDCSSLNIPDLRIS